MEPCQKSLYKITKTIVKKITNKLENKKKFHNMKYKPNNGIENGIKYGQVS